MANLRTGLDLAGTNLYPSVCAVTIFFNAPAYFEILGIRIMRIPNFFLILEAIPFFLVAWWQYRVLTDPRIKQIFERASRA
jgi:hypothetical protein